MANKTKQKEESIENSASSDDKPVLNADAEVDETEAYED